MFGSKKTECPIQPEMRLWMENAFLWLAKQFGTEEIAHKKILLPSSDCFPVDFDGSKDSLNQTAEIIAQQMEIDINSLELEIFDQTTQEIQGDFGYRIFTKMEKDEGQSAGRFYDKTEDGKYQIFVERKNLKIPETLVAVIAHEFAHIKILGEKRLDFNDEHLTDLATVVLGVGIFNANSAFKQYSGFDGWGYRSVGYLKQREWGYALALYAYYRNETNPEWLKYLTPNLKSDFRKSESYINANPDKIFKENYKS
jgi:hypothetical protein